MKKQLAVVGVCLALALGITFGVVVQAKAQAGFIFGCLIGSSLNNDSTNQASSLSSNVLYQNTDAFCVVNIFDVRYIDTTYLYTNKTSFYLTWPGNSFVDTFLSACLDYHCQDEMFKSMKNRDTIDWLDFLTRNVVVLEIVMSSDKEGRPMLQFYYVHRDRLPATYGMETGD